MSKKQHGQNKSAPKSIKIDWSSHFVLFVASILLCLLIAGLWMSAFNLKTLPIKAISATGEVRSLNLTKVEVARSEEEREIGLMNRKYLCPTCGMLFVFEEEAYHNFWMKNTFIALDMIFMDENGKIITIHKNTIPKNEEIIYRSKTPAKYVLETNKGFAESRQLAEGDVINIQVILSNASEYDFMKK